MINFSTIGNKTNLEVPGFVIQRSKNKKAYKFLKEVDNDGVLDYLDVEESNRACLFLNYDTALATVEELKKFDPNHKFRILNSTRSYTVLINKTETTEYHAY